MVGLLGRHLEALRRARSVARMPLEVELERLSAD
jgi:hypothetical protein